jgi:hypothetical protein
LASSKAGTTKKKSFLFPQKQQQINSFLLAVSGLEKLFEGIF